ncbi:hypothetical protein NP233_g3908 [Leucocoprinus birnbaumii]|uniref:Nephrocystin 3-like N-terminal domain-containing protein n=1 Tax=Leucocoprinus birnbaumii TaxID=56174 RepID=A0AAD5VWF0_9AGAR|nr:hypothetical protein NP233_g3908 [Leucocoprinus birnbaumii]
MCQYTGLRGRDSHLSKLSGGTSDGGEMAGARPASEEDGTAIQASKTNNAEQEVYDRHTVIPGMESYIMHDVAFDSPERDPPPRCCPGTRTDILEAMIDRVADPEGKTRLMWLHGPPGVGKSAIIQTLVEVLSTESQCLGAAVFLLGPTQHSRHIFPTIANQLANRNPSYKSYLTRSMKSEKPSLDQMSLEDLFQFLFVKPFTRKRRVRISRCVIVLDGLSGCFAGQLMPDLTAASLIADPISESVRQNSVPLIWIISSRSCNRLHKILLPTGGARCEFVMDTDPGMGHHEIETFLHSEIQKIRQNSSDTAIDEQLPDNTEIQQIAQACWGNFLMAESFLSTSCNPSATHPSIRQLVRQTEYIPPIIPQAALRQSLLDLTYARVLARIPQEVLPTARKILGLILVDDYILKSCALDFVQACKLLGLCLEHAVVVLASLHPLVYYSEGGLIIYPRFYDLSFMEFITDSYRSPRLSITAREIEDISATIYLRYTLQAFTSHLEVSPPAGYALQDIYKGLSLSRAKAFDLFLSQADDTRFMVWGQLEGMRCMVASRVLAGWHFYYSCFID